MAVSQTITLRQIEAFKAVIEATSVTAAAEAMRISQPGVSRLLRNLEETVGFALFERRKGRLIPTVEARLFYDEVQAYFRNLQRLNHAASNIKALAHGQLRIGSFVALSIAVTPAVIRKFHAAHPKMRVTCTTGQSRQIVDLVASRFTDLGIIDPIAHDGTLRLERRWAYRCVCALPAGHPLAAATTISTEALSRENVIGLDHGFLSRFPPGAALYDAIAKRMRVQVHQSITACALVAEGVGVAIVDPFTALHFERQGLVIRPIEAELPFEGCVVSPPEGPLSNAARKFLTLLDQEMEDTIKSRDYVRPCQAHRPGTNGRHHG